MARRSSVSIGTSMLILRSLALLLVAGVAGAAAAEPVVLTAADGVKVFGEVWRAQSEHSPVILAFHQAESSHAEYATLAPRLNAAGFTVLAIDQRSGGRAFGGINQTVAKLGHSTGYDAALPDLAAALAWGRTQARGAPVLIWGSSYSAALVFALAARNPGKVAAVLAFSPGEYLGSPDAVRAAAKKVSVPVFVTQASDLEEIEQARSILAAVPGPDKVQFVPSKGGEHGSSTLIRERNPAGADENWQAVLRFLARFKEPAKAPR